MERALRARKIKTPDLIDFVILCLIAVIPSASLSHDYC